MAVQMVGVNNHNTAVSANENAQNRKAAREKQDEAKKMQNGTINMNELDGKMDSILMRRQKAQGRAMKVIGDAWNGDRKINEGIEESKNHIRELQAAIDEDYEFVDKCEAHKAELMEEYGVETDSQEQKDLELLEKQNKAKTNPNIYFSEEEEARIAELKDMPRTEYQQRCLDIDASASIYQGRIDKAQREIIGEHAAIRAVRLEKLKKDPMVGAQKEAAEIMEAASKDIIGMLAGEAQDHVQETLEEKKEDAKEKAEEKEEQEEKIEEVRDNREELQEQLEIERTESRESEKANNEQRENAREQAELLENAGGYSSDGTSASSEAQLEIKAMLQKMKLLEEDIKGAKVDNMA